MLQSIVDHAVGEWHKGLHCLSDFKVDCVVSMLVACRMFVAFVYYNAEFCHVSGESTAEQYITHYLKHCFPLIPDNGIR